MWYAGEEFDKTNCKGYKTVDGGLKAAQKANLNLYDEEGRLVHEKTQEIAQEQRKEGTADVCVSEQEKGREMAQNESTEAHESIGTFVATVGTMLEPEMKKVDGIPAVRITGKIRRVFNGNLRIRNSPTWDVSAVRGVSAFEEKKVTHLLKVDGKPMYRTTEGYYVSGDEKHVRYEE